MATTDIITSLLTELANGDTQSALTEKTGASSEESMNVIMAALPSLLGSLNQQTETKEGTSTVESLLAQFGSNKKENLAEKINNTDEKAAASLLSSLLGSNEKEVETSVSKATGVDTAKVAKTLATVAPIVLSFVSYANKQKKKESESNTSDVGSLLGSLVSLATANNSKSNAGTAATVINILGKLMK